ncbi:recombinase family protein [Streptosporangium sp. NPDC020145]|uniref:recombinase family protein n=1 Tax=Streptosporangium sp. NPDC020145 TaxID=3154694 RepID=UPI003414F8FE
MRAAIYARVSTEDQVDNTSLVDQERICRRYAETRGWRVVEVYREEGFTGTKGRRPQWDRLMKDARAKLFDVVVVMNWKRFARSVRVGLNLSFDLEGIGIGLAVAEMELDTTTSQGRFIRTQMLAAAEYDRDMTVDQLAKGQYGKARAGGWPSSTSGLSYGYMLEGQGRNNRVVHKTAEVEMLRVVVGWIVDEGLTRGQAAVRMNEQGYRQRNGKPWHQENLRDVLRNPGLKGELSWGGRRASGRYGELVIIRVEPVITPERWDALQAALGRNKRVAGQKRDYSLNRGRMAAPCGETYGCTARSSQSSRLYMCRGRRWTAMPSTKCSCPNLRADDMEARVWAEVVALLGDPDRLGAMARDWLEGHAEQTRSEQAEFERVTAQIAKLKTSLTTTIVEYAKQGLPAEALAAATDQINQDIAALERRQVELTPWRPRATAVADLTELATSRLVTMAMEQRKEVLALLDVKVTVLDGSESPRIRIEGSLPLASDAAGWGNTLACP